jgi:hypothetical protein
VRIAVDGPQNATVRVDGADLRDWFGTQNIAVGSRVFEFIPPNSECCERGPSGSSWRFGRRRAASPSASGAASCSKTLLSICAGRPAPGQAVASSGSSRCRAGKSSP